MRYLIAAALFLGLSGFTFEGEDGTYRFTPDRTNGDPCVSYDAPTESGGTCFIAVKDGGWALEAQVLAGKTEAVVHGTAIRRATTIRVGDVATIETRRARHGVRYFAAVVPLEALAVPPNKIVALDKRGRFLGRQFYDDGGSRRCDGLWDRKHLCKDR